MTGRRKIAVGAAAALLLIAVLSAALVVIAPGVVDSRKVKARLVEIASRETEGRVTVDRVVLTWLPRPRLTFSGVGIEVPGKGRGVIPSLAVEPGILPLLAGRLRIVAARAKDPAFTLVLPPPTPEAAGEKPPSLAEVQARIADLAGRLSKELPGLVVSVDNGSLTLTGGEGRDLSFRDIRARVALPPSSLRFDLSCRSDLWDGMSAKGTLSPSEFRGAGQAAFDGLRPGPAAERLFPGIARHVAASPLGLRLDVRMEGPGVLESRILADAPSVTVRRETGEWTVSALRLTGVFRTDRGKTRIEVPELRLGSPRLSASGSYLFDPGAREASLSLSARDVDVPALRAAALSLGEDVPLVRKLAEIIRGGRVPRMSMTSRGESAADLLKTRNIALEGRLEEGTIFVPGPRMELSSVRGDASLSLGILGGRGLEGRYGNSTGRAGTLRLGVTGKQAPLSLDVLVDADLGEVRPLLARLVRNRSFLAEMGLVRDLRGRASGRLLLGGRLDKVEVRAEGSAVRLTARYGRIPFPLRVERGGFRLDAAGIAVGDAGGTVGGSRFDGLSGRVAFGEEPSLENLSGGFDLFLGELFPWLSSLEGLSGKLGAARKVEGSARLHVSRLSGPMLDPARWRFEAAGDVRNLVVASPRLPGPLYVTEGRIRADPATLAVSGLLASLLDADLQATGELRAGPKGKPGEIDVTVNGVAGPEAVRAVSDLLRVPAALRVRAPLAVSRVRLVRGPERGTKVSGSVAFPDGPRVRFDLEAGAAGTVLAGLDVLDGGSRASASFERRKDRLALSYSGLLEGGTLDRILLNGAILRGAIRGNFRAAVPPGRPEGASFDGTLEGDGIRLPPEWAGSLSIDAVSLEGKGNAVLVRKASFAWLDQPFSLAGTARLDPGGVTVDMDLATRGIAVDRILRFLEAQGAAGAKAAPDTGEARRRGRFPVRGTVRLKADSVTWGRFDWRPVEAGISLGDRGAAARIDRAALCGLETTGTLGVSRGRVSVDLGIRSEGKNVDDPIACLARNPYRATGAYRFTARVAGEGAGGSILSALRGDFALSARDGRIYRFNILGKILALLNVTEIFRGKLPDLAEGLPYRTVEVRGTLVDGKFTITEEATLDGPAMGIVASGGVDLPGRKVEMTFLVSPFRTADAVIRHIPIIGYIMGGRLVAVPVKVDGSLDDPDVSVMSVSGVGAGMLGVLERTLKTPIRLIRPLIPGSGKPAR